MIALKLIFVVIVAALLSSCGAFKSKSSTNLQAHIGQARTASDQTSRHISDFKSTVEVIDYKASRAQKLLDQGVDRPPQ